MALHFIILYIPFFAGIFAITSLTWAEWQGVLLISLPVLLIDEVLKWVSRLFFQAQVSPLALENKASIKLAKTLKATPGTPSKSTSRASMDTPSRSTRSRSKKDN